MQNYGIYGQFESKSVLPLNGRRNKMDAVVVDCHHSLHFCGD